MWPLASPPRRSARARLQTPLVLGAGLSSMVCLMGCFPPAASYDLTAGAAGGATSPGGGGAACDALPFSELHNPFLADNDPDWFAYNPPNPNVAVGGGKVTITSTGKPGHYDGYIWHGSGYSILGSEMVIHVQLSDPRFNMYAVLIADELPSGVTGTYSVNMTFDNGYLTGGQTEGDTSNGFSQDPVDAPNTWWKIRESAGKLDFYVSKDGKSWGDPLNSSEIVTPPHLCNAHLNLGLGVHSQIPLDGGATAIFEHLNEPPP